MVEVTRSRVESLISAYDVWRITTDYWVLRLKFYTFKYWSHSIKWCNNRYYKELVLPTMNVSLEILDVPNPNLYNPYAITTKVE